MLIDPKKNSELIRSEEDFENQYGHALISNHTEESDEGIDYWAFWEDDERNDD